PVTNHALHGQEDRQKTARIIQAKGVIGNTARVIASARRVGMPVMYTAHVHKADDSDWLLRITDERSPWLTTKPRTRMVEGTPGVDIIDELKPAPGDHVVYKHRRNAFYGTNLEIILRSWGIETIIITGYCSYGCVAHTIQGAEERDLNVIILSDCCAAPDPEVEECYFQEIFPITARVRTSDELVAAMSTAGG
ncbi:cysteine hydrolase family protein, partial [Chloroflexota bacterium]